MNKYKKFALKSILALVCCVLILTVLSSCMSEWAYKISVRKNVRWYSTDPVFEFTVIEHNAEGRGFMEVDGERVEIWFIWVYVRRGFIVYKGETVVFDENGTQLGEGEVIFRGAYDKKGKNVRLTPNEYDNPWNGKYSEIILKAEDI